MHLLRKSLTVVFACLSVSLPTVAKQPASPDHWVGTWAAAPIALENKEGFGKEDMTLREIVHVSLGGPLTRIVLTNEFGTEPLRIGGMHLANAGKADAISLMSANALTFGGRPEVTIPAGALAISDPVALSLQPLSDVAVSIFIPAQTILKVSGHSFADQTSYLAPGNSISKASLPGSTIIHSWPFLKGVDTQVSGQHSAIVCFGDSITDGALSTENANARWPDVLAKRLHNSRKTATLGVLNEGIGGNRILREGSGPAALARLDRDVLSLSGAKYLILLEGINDIGNAFGPKGPGYPLSADDLIAAYKQIAERAHTHSIKVFGATLTPFGGAGYASPQGETVRKAFNDWIRSNKDLDGVIDFEKATRDPANPGTLAATADSGDHLHPKDGGYQAMGDAIDLSLFTDKHK
jgi:lysophospholipase L1-like esterase